MFPPIFSFKTNSYISINQINLCAIPTRIVDYLYLFIKVKNSQNFLRKITTEHLSKPRDFIQDNSVFAHHMLTII